MKEAVQITESQWLADSTRLCAKAWFASIQTRSQRRDRLFACACCRRVWHLIQMKEARQIVELSEAFADGGVTAEELEAAYDPVCFASLQDRFYGLVQPQISKLAYEALLSATALAMPRFDPSTAGAIAEGTALDPVWDFFPTPEMRKPPGDIYPDGEESARVSELLREIYGNPFHPVNFDPAWRTSKVVALADQMYKARDFSSISILADLLQDVGCGNNSILSHCRAVGPHVRGCWVVDLILGKE